MNEIEWSRKYNKLRDQAKKTGQKLEKRLEQQRRDNRFKTELEKRYPKIYRELADYFSTINNTKILNKERVIKND